MAFIENELPEAEQAEAGMGSDMKGVLFLFRDDPDRRAEADEKPQREDREEPVISLLQGKALSATTP
ncbi:hypothetical protein PF005_g7004 [Phytophthora fragariae]|uniref:Uncharacterized protein n=1 Tax=Phytophthora fragariae TaxID=53985 RepID=A0A6A3F4K3_9STRA|nr:hypothetical protein PF009_g10562 [Phytophthora fragariae]KAE9116308.1 hypothetical protein PF007_g9712 [Phytophthora fragariae]KAE9221666.1 hypothetical protein PF005_g7004 [Phytophthora fragariae]KAE9238618.1 hypothetical protein PF004_g8256 [Phytophthora fragariae]KAE9342607.1 hypothetical protein PF008_g10086 [Phytophthora fragariae]